MSWIMTAYGTPFYPNRPRPQDVDILTIAHALSNICRYGGHSRKFYSVAEHSVLVASVAPAEMRLAALLHDAAEAYVGDICRPLKKNLGAWHAAERACEEAIALKFGTPPPMDPAIKAIDDRIILDEWAVLMPATDADIGVSGEKLGVRVRGHSPAMARALFLEAFRTYGGQA